MATHAIGLPPAGRDAAVFVGAMALLGDALLVWFEASRGSLTAGRGTALDVWDVAKISAVTVALLAAGSRFRSGALKVFAGGWAFTATARFVPWFEWPATQFARSVDLEGLRNLVDIPTGLWAEFLVVFVVGSGLAFVGWLTAGRVRAVARMRAFLFTGVVGMAGLVGLLLGTVASSTPSELTVITAMRILTSLMVAFAAGAWGGARRKSKNRLRSDPRRY